MHRLTAKWIETCLSPKSPLTLFWHLVLVPSNCLLTKPANKEALIQIQPNGLYWSTDSLEKSWSNFPPLNQASQSLAVPQTHWSCQHKQLEPPLHFEWGREVFHSLPPQSSSPCLLPSHRLLQSLAAIAPRVAPRAVSGRPHRPSESRSRHSLRVTGFGARLKCKGLGAPFLSPLGSK